MKQATLPNGESTAELFQAEKNQLKAALRIALGVKRLSDNKEVVKHAEAVATGVQVLLAAFDPPETVKTPEAKVEKKPA